MVDHPAVPRPRRRLGQRLGQPAERRRIPGRQTAAEERRQQRRCDVDPAAAHLPPLRREESTSRSERRRMHTVLQRGQRQRLAGVRGTK